MNCFLLITHLHVFLPGRIEIQVVNLEQFGLSVEVFVDFGQLFLEFGYVFFGVRMQLLKRVFRSFKSLCLGGVPLRWLRKFHLHLKDVKLLAKLLKLHIVNQDILDSEFLGAFKQLARLEKKFVSHLVTKEFRCLHHVFEL